MSKRAKVDNDSEQEVKEDAVISVSTDKMKKYHVEHPRVLIPEICNLMYHLGWVTGTGGGMSMKYKSVFSPLFALLLFRLGLSIAKL
jgi:hypothetical protein